MSIAEEYLAHAAECVRLANMTTDEIVKRELLTLRQSYLRSAERLRSTRDEPPRA